MKIYVSLYCCLQRTRPDYQSGFLNDVHVASAERTVDNNNKNFPLLELDFTKIKI